MPNNYTFDLNSAIKAGYTPDQIAQYLDQQKKQGSNYQLTATPQATPQQSQEPVPKSNGFADLLPTIGSVVGGVAGAAIPILGETGFGEIGGAAAGGALGESAKELIEGKPLSAGDIATQGVVGGVGGAVGKGIGYVGGKVLSKAGSTIANNVSETAAQTINKATPAAWEKAASQHGVDLNQLTKDYVAPGSSYDDLLGSVSERGGGGTMQSQLKTAEDQIQSTVKTAGSNIRIPTATLIPQLQQEAKTLSMLPGNETKIDAINTIIKQFGKQYPNGLSAQRALAIKRTADSKFGQAVVNDEQGTAASMAQKTIANASRTVLKQMFPELSDALDTQSDILTLQPILSKARATANTQGTGFLNTINQMSLAKPQTIATVPVRAALNNPKVASRLLNPNVLPASPVVGKTVAQTAGQSVTRGILPATPDQAQQANDNIGQANNSSQYEQSPPNNNNSFNQGNTLPSTPQAAFGGNSSTNSTISQAPPSLAGYTINGKPIDPATANLIQKVASYQIDPTKITSLKNDERQRLVSLASQFDPSYDSSSFPAKAAVRKDFTSGKSAQNIRSLNTAVSHLNSLAEAGGALGNTSFTPFNQVKNAVSQTTGQPQITRFNDSLNAVAGEMSAVFKGSSGTDQEIQSWREQMNAAQSPEQIQAGINQMVELMAGRLQALESQYQTGMGKPSDFSFLNSNSKAILQKFGIDPTTLANPDALPANP